MVELIKELIKMLKLIEMLELKKKVIKMLK